MFSRYSRTPIIRMGEQYGTNRAIGAIRLAVRNNTLRTRELIIHENQRLDTMAGTVYGDARLWWILAAASDIGWGMQVPPGTVIRVPELADVSGIVA